MKIYVVETMGDYTTQIAFCDKKQKAEEIAKEMNKKSKYHEYWVTVYQTDADGICWFD